MAALVSTKKFQDDKELQIQRFWERLCEELSQRLISLEDKTLVKHLHSLFRNILRPAAELKEAMACSSIEYSITESMELLHYYFPEDGPLLDYTLKDVVEWRERDSSEASYTIFCYLFPGISRMGIERKDQLPLIKPVVLVFDRQVAQDVK
jgi:hypothetical protein